MRHEDPSHGSAHEGPVRGAASRALRIQAGAGPYEVLVGPGLLELAGPRLRALGASGKVALISDAYVSSKWAAPVRASLEASGFSLLALEVPRGEAAKTLAQAEALYGALIAAGFERGDTVAALGGGSVGDLAGFVAATYLRGVRFVQLPTTLLAQVDSSVGGKVAVDHPLGKNLVGAFHPPSLVLADTDTLQTLSSRERWSGLAEVVKAALIADPDLLSFLEEHLEELGPEAPPEALIDEAILRAVRIKAAVVEEDEREGGRRRILNFGHTIGHALEAATGYGSLTHGEAVVLGMRAAIELSMSLGRLGPREGERALALLSRFPAPPPCSPPEAGEVLAAALRDKKMERGALRFVVLSGLGEAAIEDALPSALLEEAITATVAAMAERVA